MEDVDVLFSIFVPFISRKSDQHLFVLCRIELVEATKGRGCSTIHIYITVSVYAITPSFHEIDSSMK